MKAGILDNFQIKQIINDPQFTALTKEIESGAWCSFVQVVPNFLRNRNAENNVYRPLQNWWKICFLTLIFSIVTHIHNHIDRYPENLGDFIEEQGERFHQDIKTIYDRYQRRWGSHMMADYVGVFSETALVNYMLENCIEENF